MGGLSRLLEILQEFPSRILLPTLRLPLIGALWEEVDSALETRIVCKDDKHIVPAIQINHLAHRFLNKRDISLRPAVRKGAVVGPVSDVLGMNRLKDLSRAYCARLKWRSGERRGG